ncbi:DUF5362 domain-containing protein [Blastopirellula sp. JC732]|uniref:DUF5362 domain-containing protein n=1 Tax=Blastopirellula sediminis TaxID=2894196 RepID=A0A9X1MPM6_9BACT|nr:DUF5362 family protein [Blastopirellula sediminis]MCC9606983.1 DUF5362 domain-containing protein [Blastopirellula sediminis]MCC9629722.1 DUF5362 domain-containing protein [Blastopirellula sediminis]
MSDNPFASPAEADSSLSTTGVESLGSLGILQPLVKIGVWSKIFAVAMILVGILLIISISGIIVGWLPIWAGVLLWQHASLISEAHRLQDSRLLQMSIQKLATSIKVAAIFQAIIMAIFAFYVALIVFAIGFNAFF